METSKLSIQIVTFIVRNKRKNNDVFSISFSLRASYYKVRTESYVETLKL